MKIIDIKLKIFCLTILFSGIFLSSCQDQFLDQQPKDAVSDALYFQDKVQFENAANYFYTKLEFDDGDETSDLSNNTLDDTEKYGRGLNVPDPDDTDYKDNYWNLREINQLIERAVDYPGAQSEIAAYVGTAYFFRAWHHYKLVNKYGGVVIVTNSLTVDSEELYAKRNSRYEVIDQILKDLDQAIALLPAAATFGDANQGKLTLEAAKSFKARILLMAATWDKYVGTATDGDGTTSGAGSARPASYPTVDALFTAAKATALEVMNSGAYELWDHRADLGNEHLFYLFNLEDGGSNPAGLSKADNKEYILQSVYDFNLRKINQNLSHSKKWGPTRKLMDMYVCTDGLPIQHSADFLGYATVASEFQNRDMRMINPVPMKKYWGWGNAVDGGGAQYGVDFDNSGIDFNYTFVPNLSTPGSPRGVGYPGRKFITEMKLRETRDESFNYPHLRYAEVLLTYAEATVELGNGAISDGDLDLSINKIRTRSGVAPLTNALIAPFGELTMLGEIRRERAVELFGENLRFDDLKRWGIAELELNQDVCVTVITGTEWETIENPKDLGSPVYTAGAFALTTTEQSISSYAGIAKVPAGTILLDSKSNRNFDIKNYVDAIPLGTEFDLNENLLQNPGW